MRERTYASYHRLLTSKELAGSKAARRFQRALKAQDPVAVDVVAEFGFDQNLSPEMVRTQLEILTEQYVEMKGICYA